MKGQSCSVNPKHDNRLNWTKQVCYLSIITPWQIGEVKVTKLNLLENESS